MLHRTVNRMFEEPAPLANCPFCADERTQAPFKLEWFVHRNNKHVQQHLHHEASAPNISRFCKPVQQEKYICLFYDCRIALPHLTFDTYQEVAGHILLHCKTQWLLYKYNLAEAEIQWNPFVVSVYSQLHQCWFSHAQNLDLYTQSIQAHHRHAEAYKQTSYYNPVKHPSEEMFIFDYNHSDWIMQFDNIDRRFSNDSPLKQLETLIHIQPLRYIDDDDEESSSSSGGEIESIDEHVYIKRRKDGTYKSTFTDPALKPLPDYMHPSNLIIR